MPHRRREADQEVIEVEGVSGRTRRFLMPRNAAEDADLDLNAMVVISDEAYVKR